MFKISLVSPIYLSARHGTIRGQCACLRYKTRWTLALMTNLLSQRSVLLSPHISHSNYDIA